MATGIAAPVIRPVLFTRDVVSIDGDARPMNRGDGTPVVTGTKHEPMLSLPCTIRAKDGTERRVSVGLTAKQYGAWDKRSVQVSKSSDEQSLVFAPNIGSRIAVGDDI